MWFKPGCIDSRVSQNQLNPTTNGVSTYSFKRSVITNKNWLSEPCKDCVLVRYSFNVVTTQRVSSLKGLSSTRGFLIPGLLVLSGQQSEKYSNIHRGHVVNA